MSNAVKKRELYERLINEKKNGKIFTKEDLTYDILYELAIVENVCDNLIGDIFNMSKSQVCYQRRKNNLENVFLKKMISRPEIFKNFINEKNLNFDSSLITEEIIYNSLKLFAKSKGWKVELIDKYIAEEIPKNQKNNKTQPPKQAIKTNINEYSIEVTDSCITSKSPTTKRIVGRHCNQLQNAIAKIKAGELGQEIVVSYEKNRLKGLELPHLAKKVRIITKTAKKNITYDGAGYDVASYNEKGEKIYIEVKSSITRKKDMLFFISNKEVAFINGKLKGIDKEHALIYYIYNIDKKQKTAKIEIIDYEKFNALFLEPVNYKVSATLTTKNS